MGPLQIPDPFIPGFVALADLDADRFGQLVGQLREGPLFDPGQLAEQVVAPAADVGAMEAQEIVASLTSLFGYHRRAHESLADVAAGVSDSPDLGALDDDGRTVLAQRIERLLRTRAVSGTAKAVDLQHHRHAISSVHVVTETRFLFDEEDLEPSEAYGAVLTHTLRIQTMDDDHDTIFTMTDQGLRDLQVELGRAAKKRSIIGGRLRQSGFTIFGDGEESTE